MKKNQSDARRARRIASRYGEHVEIFDLGDGLYELAVSIGGASPCACSRCDMLRALAVKSDGPPSARATHQFETLTLPEVRHDKAI